MKKEIIELISNILEIDKSELNENTNLTSDLDIESLDLVDLIAAFEKKYNLIIPDNDIKNFQTIKDIIEYLENHV